MQYKMNRRIKVWIWTSRNSHKNYKRKGQFRKVNNNKKIKKNNLDNKTVIYKIYYFY